MPYSSAQRRNIMPAYELDEDLDQGFHNAVKGSQPNMALRYLEEIVKNMQSEIADLKRQIVVLTDKAAAKPVTQKPAAKKEEENV